ncbi:MAG: hypothetical protein HY427_00900, partial [Candidatus Levybacteria bacterium]|nr:hypothetical protein [Candidatus Levybacteria bacterium]
MKITFPKLLPLYLLLLLSYFSLLAYPYLSSKITRFSSLGFLSLVEERSEDIKKIGREDEHLLKGEKIVGKLRASANNIGILLVRFSQLSAIVTDRVLFRIKEEGESKWYYENNYNANQFQPNEYFTFGFPSILDSKGKTYQFEVESLSGTFKNGIGLSSKKPQTALVYKYTKEDLKNFNTLLVFMEKKLIYVINNSISLIDLQILSLLTVPFLFVFFTREKKIKVSDAIKMLPSTKKNRKKA